MKLAYSYIRFSSRKQEQNDSVRRQTRLRDEWLHANPEVTLDTQVSLQDLGVSAFRGANLDAEWGDLGKFINLAERENSPIKKGSYLLLERLDRFSRQKVSIAYTALMRIVRCGIKVVVLDPVPHQIDDENVDQLHVVLPIITNLCLAHEQSREKSKRVSHAWQSRREDTRNEGKLYTKRTPAWICYDEDKRCLKLNESKADAVRYIFKRAVEGVGQVSLVKELNSLFEPITGGEAGGKHKQWNTSYVCKILNDRSVIGEFQPHTIKDGKTRVADGDPIKGYFPIVVSDEVFYQAQYQKSLRKKERIESRSHFVNLFTGLVVNVADGSQVQIQTSRTKRKDGGVYLQRRLWSYANRCGMPGSCPWSIEYDLFEKSILNAISELNPDSFRDNFEATKERQFLHQQIEGYKIKQSEIEKVISDISTNHSIASAMKIHDDIQRKKEQAEARLNALVGAESVTGQEVVEGLKSISQLIAATPNDHVVNLRHKIKSIIPTIIESIGLRLYKRSNNTTFGMAHLRLRDGTDRFVSIRNPKGWKDLNRVVFYDAKKRPVLLLSPTGAVFWSPLHRLPAEERNQISEFDMESLEAFRDTPAWTSVDGKMRRFGAGKILCLQREWSDDLLLKVYLSDQTDDFVESKCVWNERVSPANLKPNARDGSV